MDDSKSTLAVRLSKMKLAEPGDYIQQRRSLIEDSIEAVSSSDGREKLRELQAELDKLRAIAVAPSQSLLELLILLRGYLEQMVHLTDQLQLECDRDIEPH